MNGWTIWIALIELSKHTTVHGFGLVSQSFVNSGVVLGPRKLRLKYSRNINVKRNLQTHNDPKDGVENQFPKDKNIDAKSDLQEVTLNNVTDIRGAASVFVPDSPMRYILPLSSLPTDDEPVSYVMIDVPPFTEELRSQILEHCGGNQPIALLITNCNSLCSPDEGPGGIFVASSNRDIRMWKESFKEMKVVMHRIDIPREMRHNVTQVLDGYGPWSWDEDLREFKESGNPMKVVKWDDSKVTDFFRDAEASQGEEEIEFIKNVIRMKEMGKKLLAVYTPGHTMGSVCYVLPEIETCASGFTIPEDTVTPRLDYKGYISTNKGTIDRQVESINELLDVYFDRFRIILPSRGEVLVLNDDLEKRKSFLGDIVSRFAIIGKAYETIGKT